MSQIQYLCMRAAHRHYACDSITREYIQTSSETNYCAGENKRELDVLQRHAAEHKGKKD